MEPKALWEHAFEYCRANGLSEEAVGYWRRLPNPSDINDRCFLEELAWCVFNAGMKEKVVRGKWEDIRAAFQLFDIEALLLCESEIPSMMANIFNHQGKTKAVIAAAKKIKADSPVRLKWAGKSEEEALAYLETYPFIGKIVKYHLARNIGFDVVKPDRHLERLAAFLGKETPDKLVSEVSEATGERKGFIDYVFWQWLAWEGAQAYDRLGEARRKQA